jgi:hypothetical protein
MLSLLEASPGPDINSTLDRSPPSLSFAAFSSANAKPGLISPLCLFKIRYKAATQQQQQQHVACRDVLVLLSVYTVHLQHASHREQYTPQSVHIYCKYYCKAAYIERVYTDCTINSTLHSGGCQWQLHLLARS